MSLSAAPVSYYVPSQKLRFGFQATAPIPTDTLLERLNTGHEIVHTDMAKDILDNEHKALQEVEACLQRKGRGLKRTVKPGKEEQYKAAIRTWLEWINKAIALSCEKGLEPIPFEIVNLSNRRIMEPSRSFPWKKHGRPWWHLRNEATGFATTAADIRDRAKKAADLRSRAKKASDISHIKGLKLYTSDRNIVESDAPSLLPDIPMTSLKGGKLPARDAKDLADKLNAFFEQEQPILPLADSAYFIPGDIKGVNIHDGIVIKKNPRSTTFYTGVDLNPFAGEIKQ